MPDAPLPVLVAHRGDPSRAPENTLASVRAALEARPDFIEVDVHLSADGEVVVIHDADLERTTSGRGPVSEHSLAQLRGLDAGRWFGEEFAGEPLPTLREVWAAAGEEARLAVELKGEGTGAVVGRWARGLTSARPTFLSFRVEELRALGAQFPEAELRLLSAEPLSEPTPAASLASVAAELGCVGVSVRGPECSARSVEEVHERGLEVWVWTVDEPAEWGRLLAVGVEGLVTNTPLALSEFLRGWASGWG